MRALLVLVVACALVGCSAATSAWQDIAVYDCSGRAYLFPSNPILRTSIDAALLKSNTLDYLNKMITSRAKCHCPALTDVKVNAAFKLDFRNVINALENTEGDPEGNLAGCNFENSFFHLAHFTNFALPASCSTARWDEGLPCLLEYTPVAGAFDLSFQLAFDQCPGSSMPFISLSCKGTTCADFLRPCNTAADCAAGHSCDSTDGRRFHMWDAIRAYIPSFFMYESDFPAALEWLQFFMPWDKQACPSFNGNTYFDKLMSWVGEQMGSKNVNGYKFCNAAKYFTTVQDQPWDPEEPPVPLFDLSVLVNAAYADFGLDNKGILTTVKGLSTWNGILEDGTDVLSRKNGDAIYPTIGAAVPVDVDPSEFVVLTLDCSQRLSIYPSSPFFSFKMNLPAGTQSLLNRVGSVARELADCRSGAEKLTDQQFERRFAPFSPAFWQTMVLYDIDNLGPRFDDPLSGIASAIMLGYELSNGPSTCTLERYLQDGFCTADYSGLNTLFAKDVTFRVRVERCSGSPAALPTLTISCLGKDCASLMQPYFFDYCTQDADCSGGRKCMQLYADDVYAKPFVGSVLWGRPDVLSREQVTYTFAFNATDLKERWGGSWWNFRSHVESAIENIALSNGWANVVGDGSSGWEERPVVVECYLISQYYSHADWVIERWQDSYYIELYGPGPISGYDAQSTLVLCADNTYSSTCPGSTPEVCDRRPQEIWDIIGFVRSSTGQTLAPGSPMDNHGFCQLPWNRLGNENIVRAWSNLAVTKSQVDFGFTVYGLADGPIPGPVPPSGSSSGGGMPGSSSGGHRSAAVRASAASPALALALAAGGALVAAIVGRRI